MRVLLTFLFFVLSLAVNAQVVSKNRALIGKDTITLYGNRNNKQLSKAEVIIDGKPYSKTFDNFNSEDVFIADSLTQDTSITFGSKSTDMIIVTTNKAAIKDYQEKLGVFSKSYLAYLSKSSRGDKDVVYTIDNKKLSQDNSRIRSLYNIRKEEIREVKFAIRDIGAIVTINLK